MQGFAWGALKCIPHVGVLPSNVSQAFMALAGPTSCKCLHCARSRSSMCIKLQA